MRKLLGIFARTSGFGAVGIVIGAVWKLLEFWHTARFAEEQILRVSHSPALATFASSGLPPYLLIVAGCVWGVYFELKHRRTHQKDLLVVPVSSTTALTTASTMAPAEPLRSVAKVIAEAKTVVPEATEFVVRQTVTEVIIRREPEHPAA